MKTRTGLRNLQGTKYSFLIFCKMKRNIRIVMNMDFVIFSDKTQVDEKVNITNNNLQKSVNTEEWANYDKVKIKYRYQLYNSFKEYKIKSGANTDPLTHQKVGSGD